LSQFDPVVEQVIPLKDKFAAKRPTSNGWAH